MSNHTTDAVPGFERLRRDSLRAATMDNGLQTNAIYWETGHRTYIPSFQCFSQKFSWKLIDDYLLARIGVRDVADEPFVFYGSRQYFRDYHGDRDLHSIVPTRKRFNFSMNPTGTRNPLDAEPSALSSDIVNEIFNSAARVDLQWSLERQ